MSSESTKEAVVLLQRQSSEKQKDIDVLLESIALPKSKYVGKEEEAIEYLSGKLGVKLYIDEVIVREFISWEEFANAIAKEIEELGGFPHFSFSMANE